MTRLWIVRAGAHGERELAAIDQSKLFPGFLEVGDLSTCADRDAVLELLSFGAILGTLLSDILLALLDPRIRLE